MKRHAMLILGVLLTITATVAAYYKVNRADSTQLLVTAPVSRGSIVDSVEATGTLEAVTTVQVGTQVSGTIVSLDADFNSQVRKGQVIARLEPSLFQTQVAQEQANVAKLQSDVERMRVQLADAKIKLDRAKQLSDKGLLARSDLDTADITARDAQASVVSAEAQVAQARASLNQAQVTLGHSVITAPIDGIVISRNVDVGQTVAASTQAPTLFVIAKDLTQMRVNASVDEADIGRVQPGQAVKFRVDAYPGETFEGRVSQIQLQPVTVSNVVSYVTVIDVANKDLKLKPGMTANVTIEMARVDDVARVPVAALRFRPTDDVFKALKQDLPAEGIVAHGPHVWVMANNRLQAVPVQPGLSDGARTAIADGALAEGAEVVTGVASPASTPKTPASGSPLVPRMPGRNRGGAGGQGGRS